jgi:hypothetical protein
MAPAASSRILAAAVAALALCLGAGAGVLRSDIRQEEAERRSRRIEEDLRQALFGQRVVREARLQLGKPYVWGGKSGNPGFDCSGFTAYVYRSLGVPLGTSALQQLEQGAAVPREGLQAGDLVFFLGQGAPLHVGIYEGDGRFLHAPGSGKVVESSSLDSPYFSKRFLGARRPAPALDPERRRRSGSATLSGQTTHTQESRP